MEEGQDDYVDKLEEMEDVHSSEGCVGAQSSRRKDVVLSTYKPELQRLFEKHMEPISRKLYAKDVPELIAEYNAETGQNIDTLLEALQAYCTLP